MLLDPKVIFFLPCLTRSASVWGDYPRSDSGFCLRPASQAQTVAQAQSEGQGALCPYAALAPGSAQRGETDGHETIGKERSALISSIIKQKGLSIHSIMTFTNTPLFVLCST